MTTADPAAATSDDRIDEHLDPRIDRLSPAEEKCRRLAEQLATAVRTMFAEKGADLTRHCQIAFNETPVDGNGNDNDHTDDRWRVIVEGPLGLKDGA